MLQLNTNGITINLSHPPTDCRSMFKAPAIDPPAKPNAISLVYDTKSPMYPVISYKL